MSDPPPDPQAPRLVSQRIARVRHQVVQFVQRGRTLAQSLDDPALNTAIDGLLASARKPFLFVIVGEVKSGKSSLINALLDAQVCTVDTTPCTTRVQEINYGRHQQQDLVSEYEERIFLPHSILKHIAVVDTPGTNSIVREHQRITEGYIPQSDLVLFVFFAKNPYTGSAWDFLRYIKNDWQRNLLFVLQQTDLLETGELERTLGLVNRQLEIEGVTKPTIFPVSVLTGDGLDSLRDYLRREVVKSRQFNKSISTTHNLLHFLRRFDQALGHHHHILEWDQQQLAQMRRRLDETAGEGERTYQELLQRVRHQVEETRRWLDEHLGTRLAASKKNTGTSGFSFFLVSKLPQSLRQGLDFLRQPSLLLDSLSSGWETPLKVLDRFDQLQSELSRCLFRAQIRHLEINRQLKEAAFQELEKLAETATELEPLPKDLLGRRRQQSFSRARQKLSTWNETLPEPLMAPLKAQRTLHRWSSVYRFSQTGGTLSGLLIGFYFSGLLTGLVLAAGCYLGIGYGLSLHGRQRLGRQSKTALENVLAEADRRLRQSLLIQPGRLRTLLEDIQGKCGQNLLDRRESLTHLTASSEELRTEVKTFQSSIWLDEVQGEY